MKTKQLLFVALIIFCAGILVSSCERTADEYIDSYGSDILPEDEITSTFSSSSDGWKIAGDAQEVDPEFDSQGGFIWARDNTTGGVWYFVAPSKYHGNMENAYGGTIKFSLKVDATDAPFDEADVILEGNNLKIVYDTPYNPGTSWTDYNVLISSTVGWTMNTITGTAATESQIKTVLSNLTTFKIRGEFKNGPDTGSLDNVEFPGV